MYYDLLVCKECGIHPYWSWMHDDDVIRVTKKNKDDMLKQYFMDRNEDCSGYSWQQFVIDMMDEE